jgi:hypothetical protein
MWNDLTGATSPAAGGVFRIWFRVDSSDTHPSRTGSTGVDGK